jgi:hypothetical protein
LIKILSKGQLSTLGLPAQGNGELNGPRTAGPFQLLGWKSESTLGPPMRLIHPAFTVFEHQTEHGTPTVC